MGIFGGVENAKVSERGNYLKPGVYRAEVRACKYKKTRKNQDAFIVELGVLESNNQDHPVGTEATWMVTMDKDSALGNVKQFMGIALGDLMPTLSPEQRQAQITEKVCEQAISEANPLKGKVVRIIAHNVITQRGENFTKVKFLDDSTGSAGASKELSAA